MKFRKFKQNKLWRDKAVEKMEDMGSKIHWTKLNDDDFLKQLKIKLIEEAEEVCSADTKDALLEELADVLEVVDSFCHLHKCTLQDIIDVKNSKYQDRGGFNGRRFVTIAEHPENSFGEQYCLKEPEKYPEVIK